MSWFEKAKEAAFENGFSTFLTVTVTGCVAALVGTWRRALTNEILLQEMKGAWDHEVDTRDRQRREDLDSAMRMREEDRERLAGIEGMLMEILQRK